MGCARLPDKQGKIRHDPMACAGPCQSAVELQIVTFWGFNT